MAVARRRGSRSEGAVRGGDERTPEEDLRRRIAELERENEELRKENSQLQEKLKSVSREALRQAAPFRRRESKRSRAPRRPGRSPGHTGTRRPRPERVDEELEAPLRSCPECGSKLNDVTPIEQFVEDIPVVRPHVTRIVTYGGRCSHCGPVRSQHPRQVSNAYGAAAVHVGPRATGLAADLNKRLGIPLSKTCSILREHFGLKITPGGLVQQQARVAAKLAPTYNRLRQALRSSVSVHADETSWWVGGPGHWLWVFTNRSHTFYVVDWRRGRDVVTDVLGDDFRGVLVSDCLAAYEKLSCVQQKCYAHHLRELPADARGHGHGGEEQP
jgi:transposase